MVSCTAAVAPEPGTWAVGFPETWLDAVIDGKIVDLRIGGADPQLALDLVTGLHFALFGESVASGCEADFRRKSSRYAKSFLTDIARYA